MNQNLVDLSILNVEKAQSEFENSNEQQNPLANCKIGGWDFSREQV